jgi:hypothetical protein
MFFPSLKSTNFSIFQEKIPIFLYKKLQKQKHDSRTICFLLIYLFDVASMASILKTIRVAHY